MTGQNYHLQYHRSVYYDRYCLRSLSFITFYTILFYFEADIGFGSYADGNTPNDPNQDIETTINTLKDSFVKLFDPFSIKLSKPMQTSIFFFLLCENVKNVARTDSI